MFMKMEGKEEEGMREEGSGYSSLKGWRDYCDIYSVTGVTKMVTTITTSTPARSGNKLLSRSHDTFTQHAASPPRPQFSGSIHDRYFSKIVGKDA